MAKRINEKEILKSRQFTFKEVEIAFNSGFTKTYEIVETKNVVVVVPLDENNFVFFIKEYCAAEDSYMLVLPKGGIDKNELAIETANRELQEEIGYKANKLKFLAEFTIAPGYIRCKTTAYLATELIKSKSEGDEPETLEIFKYPLDQFETLIEKNKLSEARIISALFLAKQQLSKEQIDII